MFSLLKFERHNGGRMARIKFENGYGASVICTPFSYGGNQGLYELAVLDSNGKLCYETSVANDVIGHLTEEEVSELLSEIAALGVEIDGVIPC